MTDWEVFPKCTRVRIKCTEKRIMLVSEGNVVVLESCQAFAGLTPGMGHYSSSFSSSQAYKVLAGHFEVSMPFKWLRKLSCQLKHKTVIWLLIGNRLNTKDILQSPKEEYGSAASSSRCSRSFSGSYQLQTT